MIAIKITGILLSFLLGTISGWTINYLANVLPINRKLTAPICSHCGKPFSFAQSLILMKSCPNCHIFPTVREWAVQIGMPVFTAFLYAFQPEKTGFGFAFLFLSYFLLVFIIDLEHKLILNPISAIGVFIGSISGYFLHGFFATLLGGASGFIIMIILYYLGELFIKIINKSKNDTSKTDEVALGFGDVYLSGIIGLILGWPGITAGLLLAIFFGGAFSAGIIFMQIFKRSYRPLLAIPYAPFLIISTFILLFSPVF